MAVRHWIFCGLMSLIVLPVASLGAVSIVKDGENYKVTADNYTATVDKTGSVQSLVIGGTEFMAQNCTFNWRGQVISWPGTALGRNQGGGWPYKLVALQRVASQTDNVIRAEGDRWAVEYKFQPDGIDVTVSGAVEGKPMEAYPLVYFCWNLSPNLARACDPASQGELGWPLKRPFEGGKLTVLDANGAGITGLPKCDLQSRQNYSPDWPLWMYFPGEAAKGAPVSHSLKIFKKADLAHSLKVDILPPNPDHFFIGSLDATFPVKIEALYGQTLNGTLTYTGKPFVWGNPELKKDFQVELTRENPSKTVEMKITTPKPGQYNGSVALKQNGVTLVSKRVGFITSPEKIPPAKVPADFDKFWDDTMTELDKTPLDMEMTHVPEMSNNLGDVYKVKYRSWKGRWAYAWLSVPKKEGKFPATVWCPPVSKYQPGLARPAYGDLIIYAAIHGGDIAEKDPVVDFDYMNTNITSRDDYMMRYSYCCLARCFDIIKSNPKCDGTVELSGASQGGGLSLVLAGLRPASKVTAGMIALCRIDWTIEGYTKWGPQLPKGQDAKTISDIVSYYDPARFTHRITSPMVRVGFGLFDWCAPAEGIMSAVNALPKTVTREVYSDPFGDHFNSDMSRMYSKQAPIEIPRWVGTDEDNKVVDNPK